MLYIRLRQRGAEVQEHGLGCAEVVAAPHHVDAHQGETLDSGLEELQPYVKEAATVGERGCNRMCERLQPNAWEPATVCS